ncbi:MAG: hypothetical protein WBX14_06050 [Candidatus Udaeobacter sp.]
MKSLTARNQGLGGGVGRGLGVGVVLGGVVGVGVKVAVAVAVGVGVPPQPVVPFTPMEKSEGTPSLAVDVKLASKKLLLKNAFWLLPHGVPTQLAPLVVVSKERPVRSPIGVTLSQ